MADTKLGVVETRFAEIIWEHAPLSSGELVKLCEKELHWKKPTTYNVLRKLCEKGLFQNGKGRVTPLMTREEYLAQKGEEFVSETYGGSLPAFIAAFTKRNKLTEEEADRIQALIDEARRRD